MLLRLPEPRKFRKTRNLYAGYFRILRREASIYPLKEGKMLHNRTSSRAFAATLLAGLMCMPIGQAVAQEKAAAPSAVPQAKPTMAKICANCHQPEAGSLRGNFDSVAYK